MAEKISPTRSEITAIKNKCTLVDQSILDLYAQPDVDSFDDSLGLLIAMEGEMLRQRLKEERRLIDKEITRQIDKNREKRQQSLLDQQRQLMLLKGDIDNLERCLQEAVALVTNVCGKLARYRMPRPAQPCELGAVDKVLASQRDGKVQVLSFIDVLLLAVVIALILK